MSGLLFGVSWVWWLVGTIGIGGTIAAFILIPVAASAALQAIARFVVGTRIGVALLTALAVWFLADAHRSRMDEAEWKAKTALFEKAQRDRDERINQETRDAVWKEIADATAANDAAQTEVKDYEAQLTPVCGDTGFRVGSDAGRLRHLAGAGEPRGQRHQRMSAPRWLRRTATDH